MAPRFVRRGVLLSVLMLGGCKSIDGNTPSIAGPYDLATVDGHALPCCAQLDSASGDRVTTIAGTLLLGDAAPETFVATPAGWYPSSCVHLVPSGTTISISGTPTCGDGEFTLTLVQQMDHDNGSSDTTSLVYHGKYAWSDRDALIKLVDVPMVGAVSLRSPSTELDVRHSNVTGEYGPVYAFKREPPVG
ncbi:MAG TPA: hypothetical protein VHB25_13845 [Gemmatimonadaceae bacterium]|nr:hypothetical protein [Gemmatimonadaceae bacterium]